MHYFRNTQSKELLSAIDAVEEDGEEFLDFTWITPDELHQGASLFVFATRDIAMERLRDLAALDPDRAQHISIVDLVHPN